MRLLKIQVAVVLLVLATWQSVRSVPTQICQTPQCLALSALITRNMNASANPCEDFNAYACGNYRVNNLFDPSSVVWSRKGEPLLAQKGLDSVRNKLERRLFELLYFDRSIPKEDEDIGNMQRLVRNLFRSCSSWAHRKRSKSYYSDKDSEAAENLFNGILSHLMDSFGDKIAPRWFERAIGKMVRMGVWSTIAIGPSRNLLYSRVNASTNLARVSLTINTYNWGVANLTNFTSFFSQLSAAKTFGLNLNFPGEFLNIANTMKQNFTDANSTWSAVAKLKDWNKCALLLKKAGAEFSISELDELSKCADPSDPFSWKAFFESILYDSVNKDTRIDVKSIEKAINIVNLLAYFKTRSLTRSNNLPQFARLFSFLVFDWLLTFSKYLPKPLAAQWESESIRMSRIPVSQWENPLEDCMVLTKNMLGPIVDRMFQKTYHEETFDHVLELVNRVKDASIESVKNKAWITPSSKNAIIDKIKSIRNEIGFDIIPVSKLKKHYALTISSLKRGTYTSFYDSFGSLFSLAISASAERRNNLLFLEHTESSNLIRDSLIVNAFNTMRGNQIVFPMGILSPFLYHKSYPDYMNLGGIGVIIGHEIGHGFDNMGHALTTNGARGHFWDNETEAGYIERTKCVTKRFGSYEMIAGQLHNSETTVGNDIADLMGIRSAFGALQKLGVRGRQKRLPNLPDSLTPEKLFFVQAAQVWCDKSEPEALAEIFQQSAHSPSHIRIRGMMENSRDFAQVFQCKQGQAMNPSNKCEFW